MFTGSQDFYQILGVSPDATDKEMKAQYRKRMLENHPDKLRGLKARYEATDDEVLLALIEEKLRDAEEAAKLINQAFEVLSDPTKREEYDEHYKTAVAGPEIVLSTNKLDLGRVGEDQKKSESFVIENKGGPVGTVSIDWEVEPEWAELIIELTPVETFPIKVTVEVKREGATGPKKERILVSVDGDVQTVEVTVTITARPAKTATATAAPAGAATTPPPTPPTGGAVPTPAPPISSGGCMKVLGAAFAAMLAGGLLLVGMLALAGINQQRQEAVRQQEAQNALEQFQRDLPSLVVLKNVRRVKEEELFPNSPFKWRTNVAFTLENRWSGRVGFEVTNDYQNVEGIYGYNMSCAGIPAVLQPYEPYDSLEISCMDATVEFDSSTGQFILVEGVRNQQDELCLNFRFYKPEDSPLEYLTGDLPGLDMCVNIPNP